MTPVVHSFHFDQSVIPDDLEQTLLLAILAAEGLHGTARVRLEARYSFNSEDRNCVVDATTDVGRDVCRLFTGFAIREFGESAFSVRKAERKPEPDLEGASS